MKVKGVSPVIATILLIAITISIALIVFLWFRSIGVETIQKLNKNVELVCGDVKFDAEYYNGEISITNSGTIPIFNFKVKVESDGDYTTKNIKDFGDGWPSYGMRQGEVFTTDSADSQIPSGATKLVIIPVLLGESSKGERSYICKEEVYSKEIII